MLDKIVQTIQNVNSVLIIVPSDHDWSAIFASLALISALPGKQISILNDEITTNMVLAKKLSPYRFNSIHTKATQAYSIVINKKSLKIKESFFDETDDALTLSFESGLEDMLDTNSFELKKPQLNQDLILVIKSSNYSPSYKYQKVLNTFVPEKIILFEAEEGNKQPHILALNVLKTIQMFGAVSLSMEELLLISALKQTDCLLSIPDSAIFDFVKHAIDGGVDYQKCINIAKNTLEQNDLNLISQSLSQVKNAGKGIYYTIINDPYETLPLNTNLKPYFANLADCHVVFLIVARNKYSHVFMVNQSSEYTLGYIKLKFNAQGDNNNLYFETKIAVFELEKELLNSLSQPKKEAEVEQPAAAVAVDLPNESPRFTQGLGQEQPLAEALEIPIETPVIEETPVIDISKGVKIIEEC